MKFVSNKGLFKSDFEFKNIEEAKNSPLASNLFNFPFVKEVFLSENYVSITKLNIVEWNEVTNDIRSFIKEFIAAGNNLVEGIEISEPQKEPTNLTIEDLDNVSKQIISILDEYIRPAVAADGGNIMFDSYDEKHTNS